MLPSTFNFCFQQYGPFYEEGRGFSIPVMDTLKTLAKVNLVTVEFEASTSGPYYGEMLTALEDGVW